MSETSGTAPIVVFAFSRLGDFVICHSLVRQLRSNFPDRPIDIVAREPGIAIAPLMPEIRESIVDHTTPGQFNLRTRWALTNRLRRNRYKTAYVVSRAWKAGVAPLFAGIPERIGWFGEARIILINRPRFDENLHAGTAGRAAALGLDGKDAGQIEWPEPKLVVPRPMMNAWLDKNRHMDEGCRVLAMAPGASVLSKAWPVERFAEVAKRYAAKGWRIWVLGTNEETTLGTAIQDAAGSAVRLMTQNSVCDLACAIDVANVFIGNDSGPMHVAAALGKPCLGIFGPTDVRPINRHVRIVGPPAGEVWHEGLWPEVERVIEALQALPDQVAA